MLSSCSAKLTGDNSNNTNTNSATSGQASSKTSLTQSGVIGTRETVDTNFKALRPKSVPELSSKQKSQIDSKLSSTLNNIDKTLNSLEDAPEIDLNSLGQ